MARPFGKISHDLSWHVRMPFVSLGVALEAVNQWHHVQEFWCIVVFIAVPWFYLLLDCSRILLLVNLCRPATCHYKKPLWCLSFSAFSLFALAFRYVIMQKSKEVLVCFWVHVWSCENTPVLSHCLLPYTWAVTLDIQYWHKMSKYSSMAVAK